MTAERARDTVAREPIRRVAWRDGLAPKPHNATSSSTSDNAAAPCKIIKPWKRGELLRFIRAHFSKVRGELRWRCRSGAALSALV